jgi:hypothetical protein
VLPESVTPEAYRRCRTLAPALKDGYRGIGTMNLHLALDAPDLLTVLLQEGTEHATVSVSPARAGVESLVRAFDAALAGGYGDCFWPGRPGGQYWWIFKREAETMEVAVMWTRGGASLWEHVFRATDAADWVRDRLTTEIDRLLLGPIAPNRRPDES